MTDTTDAALDSWINWLEDLPLPKDFDEGVTGLQSFITALRAERDIFASERETFAVALAEVEGKLATMTAERDKLKAARWDVQHTDTMNDMVQMGLARDAALAERDAALAEAPPPVVALVEALEKLRDLMCEGIEDNNGNSGCGQCENDCTGCIAHKALALAKGEQT